MPAIIAASATWAGAILREVDAIRNLLSLRESLPSISAKAPESVEMHTLQSMKEMTIAALDSTHREQVAFCQIMLTDLDKERVNEADEIRKPIKTFVPDEQADLTTTIANFTKLEATFVSRLSKSLANTARSLKTA
ncbi:MAG: hypothetical protein WD042_08455 [Phycisphaeraceae bacterium]